MRLITILLFIININIIFSSSICNTFKPDKPKDCFDQQNNTRYTDYCCYFNNRNHSFCKTIPYSSYSDKDKYENINGDLYSIQCLTNNTEVTLLEQCGDISKANEANFEKCKKHSTVLSSCCYVKGNNDINKGCYWLGTKYEGNIKWAGVDMECSMNYLKYSIICLFFIFLFF